MNKRLITIFSAGLMIISLSSLGQVDTGTLPVVDSTLMLKQNKAIADLSLQLNERKEKLTKLEATLNNKLEDKRKADLEAQQSAENNAKVASQLTNDATDKRLTRKARKAAKEAQGDAKSARRDSRELENVQKEIESLRKRITEDEQKLLKLQAPAPRQ